MTQTVKIEAERERERERESKLKVNGSTSREQRHPKSNNISKSMLMQYIQPNHFWKKAIQVSNEFVINQASRPLARKSVMPFGRNGFDDKSVVHAL